MFYISVNEFPAYKKSMRPHIDIIYEKVSWLIIAMYIKPGMHHTIQYVLFIDLNAQSTIESFLWNIIFLQIYYFCWTKLVFLTSKKCYSYRKIYLQIKSYKKLIYNDTNFYQERYVIKYVKRLYDKN